MLCASSARARDTYFFFLGSSSSDFLPSQLSLSFFLCFFVFVFVSVARTRGSEALVTLVVLFAFLMRKVSASASDEGISGGALAGAVGCSALAACRSGLEPRVNCDDRRRVIFSFSSFSDSSESFLLLMVYGWLGGRGGGAGDRGDAGGECACEEVYCMGGIGMRSWFLCCGFGMSKKKAGLSSRVPKIIAKKTRTRKKKANNRERERRDEHFFRQLFSSSSSSLFFFVRP